MKYEFKLLLQPGKEMVLPTKARFSAYQWARRWKVRLHSQAMPNDMVKIWVVGERPEGVV